MWKFNSNVSENILVKESNIRHILNNYYNLGFGTPRTDVCATCLKLGEKIKCW